MGENLLLVDTAMEGRTTSNSAKQLLAWWLTRMKKVWRVLCKLGK